MTSTTTAAPNTDTPADIAEIIRRVGRNEMLLIDVRGEKEVEVSGLAKGAVNIPLMQIPAQADPQSPECLDILKQGMPVALYCATGVRSGKAAAQLLDYGHPEATNIGGLGDWIAAGGPLA